MRDAQMIKDAKNQVVDESFDGLRPMIKARARGNNVCTGMGQPQHILQVNSVIRRFARHDHEPAILL